MKVLVLVLDHEVLVLNEKNLAVFKTFVEILDGSEQCTPCHFVRDNKSSLSFGSHCLREPSAHHARQPQLRGYLTFMFVIRPKMNVHFRFVFGRKWNFIFVAFSFTAENEKCFSVGLYRTSQKGLGLELQSLGLEH